MSMTLITVGVALAAVAILFWSISGLLSHRNRDRAPQNAQPPPLPPQLGRSSAVGALPAAARRGSPPPLPPRLSNGTENAQSNFPRLPQPVPGYGIADPHIYDYPKCPYHRLRNIPGRQQMIFWDGTNKVFHCCKGHDFTGREH